jgi:hypothetical protein
MTAPSPTQAEDSGMVPAWRVEIYWRSSILYRMGWFRPSNLKEDRTFRTLEAAERYAHRKTGVPSLMASYMSRKGFVVATNRQRDWRDRFDSWVNRCLAWGHEL